ncbi:MAG: peptidase S16, partial [Hydrogenophaga sp.]|nr:peptidase S16 [Hydrogenophaga sp.]
DEAEPVVPVPDDLASTRDALQRLLNNLLEREPEAMNELPLQPPYHWDDCGWVANRWAELLPASAELKHRLMTLDNPLVRLELVSDLLDRMGVDR